MKKKMPTVVLRKVLYYNRNTHLSNTNDLNITWSQDLSPYNCRSSSVMVTNVSTVFQSTNHGFEYGSLYLSFLSQSDSFVAASVNNDNIVNCSPCLDLYWDGASRVSSTNCMLRISGVPNSLGNVQFKLLGHRAHSGDQNPLWSDGNDGLNGLENIPLDDASPIGPYSVTVTFSFI
jgi:hypothetical protein